MLVKSTIAVLALATLSFVGGRSLGGVLKDAAHDSVHREIKHDPPAPKHFEAPTSIYHEYDLDDDARVTELSEVVITVPAPRKPARPILASRNVVDMGELTDTDAPGRWMCKPWRESAVGGYVQECEKVVQ